MKKVGSFCDTKGCAQAHECGNNRCYWRQTLVFGFCIFGQYPVESSRNQAIRAKYGSWDHPNLRVERGTNCVVVVCDDYIPLETKPAYIPEELWGMCQQDRGDALKQLKIDPKNFGL